MQDTTTTDDVPVSIVTIDDEATLDVSDKGKEEEEEEIDEFAVPVKKSVKPVVINIESKGEIIRHSAQAMATKTNLEKMHDLKAYFGDLKYVDDRKIRGAIQHIFMNKTEGAFQKDVRQPPSELPPHVMMLGVNDKTGYMLQCSQDGLVERFQGFLGRLECSSVKKSLNYALRNNEDKHQAKGKLAYVRALQSYDAMLKDPLERYAAAFEKQTQKLPETSVAKDMQGKIDVEKLPKGVEDLKTTFMIFDWSPVPPPPCEGEGTTTTFSLWAYDFPKHMWIQQSIVFECPADLIPSIVFTNDIMVVIIPHQDNVVEARVYELKEANGFLKKHVRTLYFEIPSEHFNLDDDCFISTHICPETKRVVMGISNGLIVFDAMGKEPPRWVVVQRSRRLTCVSLFEDTILFGTSLGECVGISRVTGEVELSDMTPAREPIFQIIISNRRLLMQTSCAISGVFAPYITTNKTHQEVCRPLHMQVVGTQIYVLEKYGRVFIIDTLARNIMGAFNPPVPVVSSQKEGAPPLEFTCPSLVPHHYNAISATNTSIMVLYPNGAIARYFISPTHLRQLENFKIHGQKKKPKAKKSGGGRKPTATTTKKAVPKKKH